jgi:acyl carrier protein
LDHARGRPFEVLPGHLVSAHAAREPEISPADVELSIQRFVRSYLVDEDFTGEDPLAELHIDSLALEQLLDHLEESYRILFEPQDISRANLSSVSRAATMVHHRISEVRAGRRSW